jgi:hypothetical protein
LGNGTTAASSVPVAVIADGALAGKTPVALTAGYSHSLALCADGTLVAWGYNFYGQLGNGNTTKSLVPLAVSTGALLDGERFIAGTSGASAYHTLGMVASPPPVAVTLAATGITAAGATLNGSVNATGASTAVSFEYGPTASYGTTIAASPTPVAGTAPTAVSSPLSGLVAGTTYHYRVVATNSSGTTQGEDMTFTPSNPPVFAGYVVSTAFQTAVTVSLPKLLAEASDPDGDSILVTTAGPVSAHGGTAVLQGASILYTPATGFSGTDHFSVTLADSGGASVVGAVTVTVGPDPSAGGMGVNPPVLTVLPGGKMGLAFQGTPDRNYVVQRSVSGLDNWATLATVVADASGKVSYTDESPPAGSAFYRLGLP